MKLTKPTFYESIETLILDNFDKYRRTSDLNWFRQDYDGRQKKIPRNTLGGGNYKSESFIKNMEINESINKIIRP